MTSQNMMQAEANSDINAALMKAMSTGQLGSPPVVNDNAYLTAQQAPRLEKPPGVAAGEPDNGAI